MEFPAGLYKLNVDICTVSFNLLAFNKDIYVSSPHLGLPVCRTSLVVRCNWLACAVICQIQCLLGALVVTQLVPWKHLSCVISVQLLNGLQ